ncbi:hypothetical protein HMPREF1548_05021 [Clostridium sp. KLE 1755]|nr:hypothetical protein HMPREF1548_05021 [Clostridium sp. KLE 1755]
MFLLYQQHLAHSTIIFNNTYHKTTIFHIYDFISIINLQNI